MYELISDFELVYSVLKYECMHFNFTVNEDSIKLIAEQQFFLQLSLL